MKKYILIGYDTYRRNQDCLTTEKEPHNTSPLNSNTERSSAKEQVTERESGSTIDLSKSVDDKADEISKSVPLEPTTVKPDETGEEKTPLQRKPDTASKLRKKKKLYTTHAPKEKKTKAENAKPTWFRK